MMQKIDQLTEQSRERELQMANELRFDLHRQANRLRDLTTHFNNQLNSVTSQQDNKLQLHK